MLRLSWKLACFSIACALFAASAAGPKAARAALGVALAADVTRHQDGVAAVSFAPPFPVGQTKVGAQVDALVREDGSRTVPEGTAFTSAVYAPEGVPFAVVWKRAYPAGVPPTRADFDELAALSEKSPAAAGERLGLKSFSFDAERLRGTGVLPQTSVPDGLSSRVVFVPTRDAFVFVALFDRDEVVISRAMARLAQSLTVNEDRRLVLADLAPGFKLSTLWTLMGAVLVLAGAGGYWWRRRRA